MGKRATASSLEKLEKEKVGEDIRGRGGTSRGAGRCDWRESAFREDIRKRRGKGRAHRPPAFSKECHMVSDVARFRVIGVDFPGQKNHVLES